MNYLLTLAALFIFQLSYAQTDSYLLGKWDFEKMPDNTEMDEEGKEMAMLFFKDLSLSLDETNYTFTLMGSTDSGTYVKVGKEEFDLNSNSGTTFTVGIKKLNDEQIIFTQMDKEFILKKSNDNAIIVKETPSLDKVTGIIIDSSLLQGKWFHNGQIKNGKNNGLILKHTNDELVNYSFLENGDFINKAPLEITLGGVWNIANDGTTLIIDSKHQIERFKVLKLNDKELELYNPKNETILLFTK